MNKNFRFQLLSFILFFSFITNVFSQKGNTESLIRKANQNFEKRNYSEAIPLYLEIEQDKYFRFIEEDELMYRIAFCYYSSDLEKEKSIPYFLKFFSLSKTVYEPHYFLGKVYQSINCNDEAIEQFEILKKMVEADKALRKETSLGVLKVLNKAIDCCNYGKFLMANPIKVFDQNLGDSINTAYSEYAPVINPTEEKLAFTRRAPETTGGKISPDGDYFEDVYFSDILEGRLTQNFNFDKSAMKGYENISNFKFSNPKHLGTNINSAGHEASVAFSYDSQKLFIYKNMQVWVSNLDSGVWQPSHKMEELSFLDKFDFEPSISLSANETELYISCEQEGGYGGLDIYKSVKINGVWSIPENLGPRINTEEDEDAPYIDSNGKRLYFSSKGHSSMGGFDIFKSDFDGKEWSAPSNLGYPVNSAGDDIFFIMPSKYNRGYYSSNKAGGHGKMDLYRVTFADERPPFAEIQGLALNGDKFLPASASISLIDSVSKQKAVYYKSDSTSGNYLLMVMHGIKNFMKIEFPHFAPVIREFTIPSKVDCYQFYQESHNVYIHDRAGAIVGQKVSLYTTENKGRLMDSIHPNKENLGEKFSSYLKNADKNDSAYKNSIVDVKFYYSEDSIAKLSKSDPSILKEISPDAEIWYASKGKFSPTEMKLPEEYVKGTHLPVDKINNFFVLTSKDNSTALDELLKKDNTGAEVPRIVVLFEYGKGVLPNDCKKTLDILVDFMKKNKNFYFEISGHTDSKGTEALNKKLSLTRADAVKQYMVKRGIAPERLNTVGKGENFPNAPNENSDGSDNPIGRKNNRRIELKVLKQ